MSALLHWASRTAYNTTVAVVGTAFNVTNEFTDYATRKWYGTSVVNATGSGPVFDLKELGLNLERAFSEDTVKGVNRRTVTERDVVCAVLCKLTYEEDSKRIEVFKQWQKAADLPSTDISNLYREFNYQSPKIGYRSFRNKGVFRTNAFVLRVTSDSVVVCFRGTQPFDLIQWFTDISFRQHSISYAVLPEELKHKDDDDSDIWIHRGFLSALGLDLESGQREPLKNNMVTQLVSYVSQLMRSDGVKHVYITGHSLGAALAQQFAFALKCSAPDQIKKWHPDALKMGDAMRGLYTFGTPRSGDWKFARLFDTKFSSIIHHRVVNNDDVVGRMPFTGIRLQPKNINKEPEEFQYGATDDLVYMKLPTSNAEVAANEQEADHKATFFEKKEALEIVSEALMCGSEDEEEVIVAPRSEIKFRPDDRLGFVVGATSFLDHYPSSYCDRLAIVWREQQKALLCHTGFHLNGKLNGKLNGFTNGSGSNGHISNGFPTRRKHHSHKLPPFLLPFWDTFRLLGALFHTHWGVAK